MLRNRKLLLFINRAFYIVAAAMLIAGLVLTVSQKTALAQETCGPNQELNNQGNCVCVAGYMFTIPDAGDTIAPFCVPQKVTVCHRNNGGVGYSSIDVSINSVTSTEDWWDNGHGQHTIAGGEVGFPEDAWPDFYARNGDFIGAYGDQELVANGCSEQVPPTPTDPTPTDPTPTDPTPTDPTPTDPTPTDPTPTDPTPTDPTPTDPTPTDPTPTDPTPTDPTPTDPTPTDPTPTDPTPTDPTPTDPTPTDPTPTDPTPTDPTPTDPTPTDPTPTDPTPTDPTPTDPTPTDPTPTDPTPTDPTPTDPTPTDSTPTDDPEPTDQPKKYNPPAVASASVLIPVTGIDDASGLNDLSFGGFGMLGLGLLMTGIRRKYNL